MNAVGERPIRKAVITAAGLGTRLLPVTKAQPKEMLPVVDKPAIQYVVEEALRAGLDDILIITGRGKRAIEDHFDRAFELEYELESKGKTEQLEQVQAIADLTNIHYVRQGEPKGLGHAISMARQHVGDEPFVVLLGDDIFHERSPLLVDMLAGFVRTNGPVIALKEVAREQISLYGCAAVEPVDAGVNGLVRLTDIVEKPPADEAPSNLAIIGRYVLPAAIFEKLDQVQPGRGGEIQLTDAIAMLLAEAPVYGLTFSEYHYDTGNLLGYLEAVIDLALEREDLGPALRRFLASRPSTP